MMIGKAPFPVHIIDLSNAKVLNQPEQAEVVEGKNVIISEKRPKDADDKILDRKVVLEKSPDGKELIKINYSQSSCAGGGRGEGEGQEDSSSAASWPNVQDQSVIPVSLIG